MNLDLLRQVIHARWNWAKESYPNLKEIDAMAKAAHLQTHLASGVGKLAGYIGRHHHGHGPSDPNTLRQLATQLCANLLLDTLELANVFEVSTGDMLDVIERLQAERAPKNQTA